jgi:hypothetical protein
MLFRGPIADDDWKGWWSEAKLLFICFTFGIYAIATGNVPHGIFLMLVTGIGGWIAYRKSQKAWKTQEAEDDR